MRRSSIAGVPAPHYNISVRCLAVDAIRHSQYETTQQQQQQQEDVVRPDRMMKLVVGSHRSPCGGGSKGKNQGNAKNNSNINVINILGLPGWHPSTPKMIGWIWQHQQHSQSPTWDREEKGNTTEKGEEEDKTNTTATTMHSGIKIQEEEKDTKKATTVGDNGATAASDGVQCMNRNARRPKRANHGKRPCSRYRRRMKRNKLGRWRR
jgi:hypothetical protein